MQNKNIIVTNPNLRAIGSNLHQVVSNVNQKMHKKPQSITGITKACYNSSKYGYFCTIQGKFIQIY